MTSLAASPRLWSWCLSCRISIFSTVKVHCIVFSPLSPSFYFVLVGNFWKGNPNEWGDSAAHGRSETIRYGVGPPWFDGTDAIWCQRDDSAGEGVLAAVLTHCTRCLKKARIFFFRFVGVSTLTHFHLCVHPVSLFFSPSSMSTLMMLYIEPKPPPPPTLFFFQEQISRCSQKCWVLLFALYTQIRWGCKLSPNICSLEWSRKGKARTGLVCMLFTVTLSECVMYGCVCAWVWVNAHSCVCGCVNNYSNRCFVSFWVPY